MDTGHASSHAGDAANVVLFPHLGSGTVHTRNQMDQMVVDNLTAWASGKAPLSPVPETPWVYKKSG